MIIDVGNNQTGLNADTSGLSLSGQVLLPPGGVLPVGYPLARNILTLQGGYLSQFASLMGLGAYASGDDQVQLTNAAAGIQGGLYAGPPAANPWLNPPANTLNVTSQYVEALIARLGLRLAIVGALNGGTAVTVGSYAQKAALSGANTTPFLTASAAITAGQLFGQVCASPIWTTLAAGGSAGSGITVPVWNTNGMSTSVPLIINPGGANQETVVPTAVTATQPATAAFTVVGAAGSTSTVQLTFNVSGYQGSAGLTGPTGVNTTTFTLLVSIPNGSTAAQTATLILTALQASGFSFGAPPNILGVGAGSFSAATGTPLNGPLVYASQNAGVLTFSAAMPGAWANTLLTYTVTVLNGTTQTINGNVGGTATPVAFAGGVNGTISGTFQNQHYAGEQIIGYVTSSGATIVPVPGTAGQQNVGLALIDLRA